MIINNLILTKASRPSSHIGAKCAVELKEAVLGEDYGLPNLLAYQVRSEKIQKLYMMKVVYNDHSFFEALVAWGRQGESNVAFHVNHEGKTWFMHFTPAPEEKEWQDYACFYGTKKMPYSCKACAAIFVPMAFQKAPEKCIYCGSDAIRPLTWKKGDDSND